MAMAPTCAPLRRAPQFGSPIRKREGASLVAGDASASEPEGEKRGSQPQAAATNEPSPVRATNYLSTPTVTLHPPP